MTKKADLNFLRDAFHVKRYHSVWHVHMPETVGHHTCGVIALIFWLYDDAPPIHVVKHALHHDAPEVVTGDIPATAKWQSQPLKDSLVTMENGIVEQFGLATDPMSVRETALLKFADMADLCFKSLEELSTGNEVFAQVLANGLTYCYNLVKNELKDHKNAINMFINLNQNKYVNLEMKNVEQPIVAVH
jgi:5'-deoxynucleotidase YfbR-like HD superfamily hydrolase